MFFFVLDGASGQNETDQTRRIKKRRRRKTSKSQAVQDSSEYTEDENDSCHEENSESSPNIPIKQITDHTDENSGENEEKPVDTLDKPAEIVEGTNETTDLEDERVVDDAEVKSNELEKENIQEVVDNDGPERKDKPEREEEINVETSTQSFNLQEPGCSSLEIPEIQEAAEKTIVETSNPEVHQTPKVEENSMEEKPEENASAEPVNSQKSELKPDAEEFIPRAYRTSEIPINPNLQFIKVPPSFIPIPLMPLGDFNGQNYNPAFIPPGIPINFLPPDPKMYPNFVGFVPNNHFVPRPESAREENLPSNEGITASNAEEIVICDSTTTKDEDNQIENVAEKALVQKVNTKTFDIATVVSKLEEAAKEQDNDATRTPGEESKEMHTSPRRRFTENRNNQRYKNIPNYRRNHYNSAQNSPQRNIHSYKEKVPPLKYETPGDNDVLPDQQLREDSKTPILCNGVSTVETKTTMQEQPYQRRNPEYKKNWKYPVSQNGSPKWQQNSPVRGYKPMYNGKHMDNGARDYKPNPPIKNYSSMLKNKVVNHPSEQKHYNMNINEKQKSNNTDVKDVKNDEVPKTPPPQSKEPNQWISVSSRKKRKNNRNADEIEVSFDEKDDTSENDLFEKYDVDQLVDVVPQLQEVEEVIKVETTEEIEIGDIINTITQKESSLISNMENISLNFAMRSVEDIERELIVKDPIETETLTPEVEIEVTETEVTAEEISADKIISEELAETNGIVTEQENIKTKSSKKSKKIPQKPTTKRVIITDIDLSMNCEELKTPLKKVVTKLAEKSNDDIKSIPIKVEEKIEEKIDEEIPKRDEEDEKKKSKKKKKKSNKTVTTNSLSSSNATINNMDDSYDFLLDSALSLESVEKTNVEISHELDKIIQKGMYSSLEEKVKSLNIDDSDGFFKSVLGNISNTRSSIDKNGFNKTPDLGKFLQDSRPTFRPNLVSEENNSQNKDINKVLPDLDSPVEDGIFLENPNLTDTPQDQTTTKDEETQNNDSKAHDDSDIEVIEDDIEIEPKTLYPITEAVKEWMCKTRETTPDVEILKSPHAIYKEFCDSESETDTVVSDLTALGDEEVTVFAKELDSDKPSVKQNLMEYWENDFGISESKQTRTNEDSSTLLEKDYVDKTIELGQDVLEVYDSKYGQNEDYLNLQREVNENVNNSNYPKHGTLPYRAICCSIM